MLLRICLALIGASLSGAAQTQRLGAGDIVKLPSTPAQRIAYGSDPLQFGDLRLPAGKGPHPVAIVVHGGCWAEFADASIMANFSSTVTKAGVATWNLEYRRVGNPGGGWPATLQDVGAGIDYLRKLAETYPLDVKRVAAVGHSAGGHLVLWAAARRHLPKNSPLYVADPLPLRGAVSLGGVPDLASFVQYSKSGCGERLVRLMGGQPEDVKDRYRQGSPSELLPIGAPQWLIWGALDKTAPHDIFLGYEAAAKKSGGAVRVIVLENSAHFEMLSPETEAWPTVERAILDALAPDH